MGGQPVAGLAIAGHRILAILKVVAERLGTRAFTVPKVFGPVVQFLSGLTGGGGSSPVPLELAAHVYGGALGSGGGSLELREDGLEVGEPTLDGGEELTDPVPVRHVEVRGLTCVLEAEEVVGVELLDTRDDEVDVVEEALALDEARDASEVLAQDVGESVADHLLLLTPHNSHDPGIQGVEVREGEGDVVEA